MNTMTKITLIFLMVVLTACNSGKKNLAADNSVDYKSAKQLPKIKLPTSVGESSN